ncbi:MAG: copper amine oxidase N-terminal domain-containing protein [Gudongella sp.]|nr:copper amine oxidase N-terminal domain-containing protein [Gudongella sp.]
MVKNTKIIITSFTLILVMLFSPLGVQAQLESPFDNIDYTKGSEIRVILEGDQLEFDVAPQIVNGRVLVPMRKIFESFGLTVTWNDSLRSARGRNEAMDITFVIDSNKAVLNGLAYDLDVPAQIIGGSTLVPLRFLSERMDYNVVWNGESQLILLSKSPIVEWRYGGFEAIKPYKEYQNKYINGEKTKEFRYTGENHNVTFVNLFKKDGSLVQNVPDFKLKDYGSTWSQKSSFIGDTYWIYIDELAKWDRTNPIYLEQDLERLDLSDIEETSEVGNYVKVKINEQYFDLEAWKKAIGTQNSILNSMIDESMLDEKEIEAKDTLFKVEINDRYDAVISFNTLNEAVFNRDSDKIYTVLEKSPGILFDWDVKTWKRVEENMPWTGMTQDMLLVQFKMKPDQTTKLTTKFSDIELWIYTEDYGDSIYYFKDEVLKNIL